MKKFPLTLIHSSAREGFSTDSLMYSRGRPGYPDALGTWLCNRMRLDPEKTAVDLGAGTGKFTGLLIQTGAKIIAIEPVDVMREQFSKNFPSVPAIGATAESMPLDSGSVDAVICAQSFHWFATAGALTEIHRVLAPGGRLGLVWNVRDESCRWVAATTKIIERYEGDTPRFHQGTWRQPFDRGHFSPLEESLFRHQHVGTPQQVIVDRFLSVSFIAALPAAEKAHVRERLETLIKTDDDLRDRSVVVFPYRTEAYCCVRR